MAYALASDVEAAWRPLTAEEEARASVLLDYAALVLQHHFPTLDARIAAGTLDVGLAQLASVQMAQRALSSPEAAHLESATETAGPFSKTERFREVMALVQVTDAEARLLRPAPTMVGTVRTKAGLW